MSVEEQQARPEQVTVAWESYNWLVNTLGELTGDGGLPDRIQAMADDAGRDHRQDLIDVANELRRHKQ